MRSATIERNTKETQIELSLNLDGTGQCDVSTGIGFFDHMLEQIARHGLVDIKIKAVGDLKVDGHHTVEDVGIALGMALDKAIGDKRGIVRYGYAYVPLDEALSRVVMDYSGRAGLSFNAEFAQAVIGELESALIKEFFQALVNHAKITLHVDCIRGDNAHHQAETIFKAFGRALRMASTIDERAKDVVPSTKGAL